jgi:hypothetical protein
VVSRAAGALITGPLAFFVSGLLDVIAGLRLAALYLYRRRAGRLNRSG